MQINLKHSYFLYYINKWILKIKHTLGISQISKSIFFLFIYFYEIFYFKKIALILKTNSMSKI